MATSRHRRDDRTTRRLDAVTESSAAATREWLSPTELAEELRIPVRTVYQWRYRGEGPVGHRVGRHVRYRRADIERWLAAQRDDERQERGWAIP